MFSSNTNKFQHPQENRYGRKPTPEKLNFDNTDTAPALEYLAPAPIWEILGITEIEYYDKYHKPPPNDNALSIQQDINAPTIITGTST
jgi:hypothetical protein